MVEHRLDPSFEFLIGSPKVKRSERKLVGSIGESLEVQLTIKNGLFDYSRKDKLSREGNHRGDYPSPLNSWVSSLN